MKFEYLKLLFRNRGLTINDETFEKALPKLKQFYLSLLIESLNKIPRLYEIPRPKPAGSSTTTGIKRYDPIDWKTAFPKTLTLNGKTPIYINGNSGPNIVCLHGAGHSGLSFA